MLSVSVLPDCQRNGGSTCAPAWGCEAASPYSCGLSGLTASRRQRRRCPPSCVAGGIRRIDVRWAFADGPLTVERARADSSFAGDLLGDFAASTAPGVPYALRHASMSSA